MVWTRLNTAVLAPIPRASTMTAAAVNPGALKSWRRANLRSWIISNGMRFAWLLDSKIAAGVGVALRQAGPKDLIESNVVLIYAGAAHCSRSRADQRGDPYV